MEIRRDMSRLPDSIYISGPKCVKEKKKAGEYVFVPYTDRWQNTLNFFFFNPKKKL